MFSSRYLTISLSFSLVLRERLSRVALLSFRVGRTLKRGVVRFVLVSLASDPLLLIRGCLYTIITLGLDLATIIVTLYLTFFSSIITIVAYSS